MKTIKISPNLKLIIVSLAITLGTTSFKPANAQKSKKSIPEIGWSSRLSSMGLDEIDNIGKSYTFDCQPAFDDLIHAPVWGTKIYTINSGICTTAVHSGMIAEEEGGKVTIKLLKGKKFYTGSRKNDVISKDHRNTNMSFTFTGKKVVENKPITTPQARQQKQKPSAIEKVLVEGLERGVERSIQNVITEIFD